MKFLRMLVISCSLLRWQPVISRWRKILPRSPGAGLSPNPTAVITTSEIATPAVSNLLGCDDFRFTYACGRPGPVCLRWVSASRARSPRFRGLLPTGWNVILHGILNQQETLNLNQPLNPDGSFTLRKRRLPTVWKSSPLCSTARSASSRRESSSMGTKSSYDQPVTIYASDFRAFGLEPDQVHVQASFDRRPDPTERDSMSSPTLENRP